MKEITAEAIKEIVLNLLYNVEPSYDAFNSNGTNVFHKINNENITRIFLTVRDCAKSINDIGTIIALDLLLTSNISPTQALNLRLDSPNTTGYLSLSNKYGNRILFKVPDCVFNAITLYWTFRRMMNQESEYLCVDENGNQYTIPKWKKRINYYLEACGFDCSYNMFDIDLFNLNQTKQYKIAE